MLAGAVDVWPPNSEEGAAVVVGVEDEVAAGFPKRPPALEPACVVVAAGVEEALPPNRPPADDVAGVEVVGVAGLAPPPKSEDAVPEAGAAAAEVVEAGWVELVAAPWPKSPPELGAAVVAGFWPPNSPPLAAGCCCACPPKREPPLAGWAVEAGLDCAAPPNRPPPPSAGLDAAAPNGDGAADPDVAAPPKSPPSAGLFASAGGAPAGVVDTPRENAGLAGVA